ncbi:MAG: 4-hydroxy-tetrahydrodipicolinate reductase [Oscillospiraceae bacterium]|nr:4-hydroxy-tetrahydrodipicolinate reductase [Oscillospiraceae bacterium]
MVKVIISGILGKMGGAVLDACIADGDISVVAGVDRECGEYLNIPIFSSIADCSLPCDAVVDFSVPSACGTLCDYCEAHGARLVMCTTGLGDAQMRRLEELSGSVAVFQSANMSLGVAVMKKLAQQAAVILHDKYDIEIIEKHHNKKVDAPSGTALLLADAINECCSNRYDYTFDRSQARRPRPKTEIGISSIRGGTIPGEHEVLFAGEDETLSITHTAYSKRLFAVGAVAAVKFIARQKRGLFSMDALV